jgi:hypothetical protein
MGMGLDEEGSTDPGETSGFVISGAVDCPPRAGAGVRAITREQYEELHGPVSQQPGYDRWVREVAGNYLRETGIEDVYARSYLGGLSHEEAMRAAQGVFQPVRLQHDVGEFGPTNKASIEAYLAREGIFDPRQGPGGGEIPDPWSSAPPRQSRRAAEPSILERLRSTGPGQDLIRDAEEENRAFRTPRKLTAGDLQARAQKKVEWATRRTPAEVSQEAELFTPVTSYEAGGAGHPPPPPSGGRGFFGGGGGGGAPLPRTTAPMNARNLALIMGALAGGGVIAGAGLQHLSGEDPNLRNAVVSGAAGVAGLGTLAALALSPQQGRGVPRAYGRA